MKYDPKNKDHRLFLAGKVLGLLEEKGFVEVEMPNTEERVFEWRVTTKTTEGTPVETPIRLLIYTSIDKRTKEIREVGYDAIRICGVRAFKDGTEKGCIKRKRVNRVGLIEDILDRVITRCRTAYVEAIGAYRNPTFCKDCGAMNFITKKGTACCSDLCWTKKAGYVPKTKKSYRPFKKRYGRKY